MVFAGRSSPLRTTGVRTGHQKKEKDLWVRRPKFSEELRRAQTIMISICLRLMKVSQ